MRAVCVAALVFAVPVSTASAATLLVDDGGGDCPNAPFTAIQPAVDAAQPGDTVAICPGQYASGSEITVNQPLTIRGAGADLVSIEANGPLAGAIVEARGGGPVQISGVTIAAQSPDTVFGAVSFLDTSGSLERSRLTDLSGGTTGSGRGLTALVTGSTARTVGVSGSLIEGYGPYGVRFESGNGVLNGSVTGSVVHGRGSTASTTDKQDGVQVVGASPAVDVTGNLIADNRVVADEVKGAAIRMFAASDAITVTDNDIQGNGYGLFRGDASGECDLPSGLVVVSGNWWGHPLGYTFAPQPVSPCPGRLPLTGPPTAGDRANSGVGSLGAASVPHGAPAAPAPQTDAPPQVAITSPADSAAADPGTPVTVSASATDDFDVKRVEFRRGATLVGSDTTPPYSAAVNAPAAGTSQVVTATAVDSSGQSAVAAISLRGTLPPEQPATPQQPDTPQSPGEPEDRPPTVAITGPAPGAQVDPSAAPRITADAADDRGVARVVFFDDGQQVCSDDTAPYDCAYAPTGGDVGRNTLIAIAVDGAGQGAVDFRAVEVRRFNPKLTARTTPKRDRRRPYRYTTSGSVLLPAGVTPEQACSGGGSVAIELRAGKLRLPMTATLRSDCSFRMSIAFPSRRSLGSGRIGVTAKFGGNTVLGTAKAPSQKVRAG